MRLTFMVSLICSSVSSRIDFPWPTPALLITMDGSPCSARMDSATSWIAFESETSSL